MHTLNLRMLHGRHRAPGLVQSIRLEMAVHAAVAVAAQAQASDDVPQDGIPVFCTI